MRQAVKEVGSAQRKLETAACMTDKLTNWQTGKLANWLTD